MGLHHSKGTKSEREDKAIDFLTRTTFDDALPRPRAHMRIIPAYYSVGQALKVRHENTGVFGGTAQRQWLVAGVKALDHRGGVLARACSATARRS